MNNAQIQSIVTKAIVGASAAFVAKMGISSTQWGGDVADLVVVACAAGAFVYSHYFHKNNPPITK